MNATDLMALIMLAEDDPAGTYLLEELDGQLILWRMSEGEPDADIEHRSGWGCVRTCRC